MTNAAALLIFLSGCRSAAIPGEPFPQTHPARQTKAAGPPATPFEATAQDKDWRLASPRLAPGLATLPIRQVLARAGNSKTAIYGLLENALEQLRMAPHFRDGDEDAVLDVMDALGGWCHPGAALLPDQPGF
jgi:hypothetical protein